MRTKNLWSVRQVSIRAGIDQSHLHRILAGRKRPSAAAAKRLESVTGIPAADWIFAESADIRSRFENVCASKKPGKEVKKKAV